MDLSLKTKDQTIFFIKVKTVPRPCGSFKHAPTCLHHDVEILRTLLTIFTLVLKAEAGDYGKGRYISDAACGVRPITMHWVSRPIRADWACLVGGRDFVENKAFERGGV